MSLSQLDFHSKTIGDNTFYIRPLPAFKAANLSGELASVLLPLLSGIAPLVSSDIGIEDLGSDEVAPAMNKAFSNLSGDKVESLLKKLLIQGKTVSVVTPDDEDAKLLTEDLANEVFSANVQDMFVLAFEVIKTNFGGFFDKISALSGPLTTKVAEMKTKLTSTESST
ncbi:MAG: hypothetical protein OSJ43_06405 [Oscillospiraceae bacterium]|nr:hypothetical protein [Oscillospiraceae bacterium]